MLKSKKIVMTGLLTAVIIISGFIKIPMYPVPVSALFLTVNFIALTFSRKISFLSILIYLCVGLAGVPVFAGGGGIGYVLSPSFGYIIGFILICIYNDELKKINVFNNNLFFKKLLLSIINMFVIYLFGSLHGYIILGFYLKSPIDIYYILLYYVGIFIPGDLLASVLSSYISKRLNFVD